MLLLCRQFGYVLNQPESDFLGREYPERETTEGTTLTLHPTPYTAHHSPMPSPLATVGGIPRRIVNFRKGRLLLLLRTNTTMQKIEEFLMAHRKNQKHQQQIRKSHH
jgi:hypothetical protein